jgi:nucleolar complex protein 2
MDEVQENFHDDSVDDCDGGGDDDDEAVDSDGTESCDYENEGSSDAAEDSDGSNMYDGYTHRQALEKLRDTDPEFYKYLEQNDRKLLQFNVSDSEDEAEWAGEDKEEEEEEEEDQIHKPSNELEVS